jgi:hypothetical protein
MTLIDRYLQHVRRALPADRRDDIARELEEDIRAQASDREETLGRPLTDQEQTALLEQFGHPMVLANRYQPQRHVIGPIMFPVYWMVLKIALGGAVLVNVALAIGLLSSGTSPGKALGPLATFPFTIAPLVFGWVTFVFAMIDLNLPRLLTSSGFDLTALPELPPVTSVGPPRRWTILAEIVGSTIFLIWWLSIPNAPFLILGPAAAFIQPAPVWQQVYLPMAALWIGNLALLWAVLLRPDWGRRTAISRLGSDTLALAIAFILLRADRLIALVPGVAASEGTVRFVELSNNLLRFAIAAWVAATLFTLARDLYRYLTTRPPAA